MMDPRHQNASFDKHPGGTTIPVPDLIPLLPTDMHKRKSRRRGRMVKRIVMEGSIVGGGV